MTQGNALPPVIAYCPADAANCHAIQTESAWVLLTFFGDDIVRVSDGIVAEVRSVCNDVGTGEVLLRAIIAGAVTAVSKRRPLGSNQGASIAVACRDGEITDGSVRIVVASLGECRAWHLDGDRCEPLGPNAGIYLGGYLLAPEAVLVQTRDLSARAEGGGAAYLVLAPAGVDPRQVRLVAKPVGTTSWHAWLVRTFLVFVVVVVCAGVFYLGWTEWLHLGDSSTVPGENATSQPTEEPELATQPAPKPSTVATIEPLSTDTPETEKPAPDSEKMNTDVPGWQGAATKASADPASPQAGPATNSDSESPEPRVAASVSPSVTLEATTTSTVVLSNVSARIENDRLRFNWQIESELPDGQSLQIVIWRKGDKSPLEDPECYLSGICGVTLLEPNPVPPNPLAADLRDRINDKVPKYLNDGQEYYWTVYRVDETGEGNSPIRMGEALSPVDRTIGSYPRFVFRIGGNNDNGSGKSDCINAVVGCQD